MELGFGTEREPYHALGRFRLSVTDRPFPLFPPSLQTIKADTKRDGRTRLGAAYVLKGDWTSAAAVLARAAARPDARCASTISCWPWPAITWAVATRREVIATAPSGGSRTPWPT